jgi:hypothetical protein
MVAAVVFVVVVSVAMIVVIITTNAFICIFINHMQFTQINNCGCPYLSFSFKNANFELHFSCLHSYASLELSSLL